MPTSLGDALRIVVEDSIGRRHAKVNAFAQEALDGLDPDLVNDRLKHDDVETLFLNAAEAAAKSSVERKRRALARVARNAILDAALVDESTLLVGVLTQVEAPHIAALARLAAVEDASENRIQRARDPEGVARAGEALRVNMVSASQRENSSVLGALRGLGLALPGQTWDSISSYDVGGITPLGRAVLVSLDEAAGPPTE